MLLYVKIPENVESRNKWEVIPVGQWLWSSGQRACLRLLRSKFESREVDIYYSVNCLKRTKINKKRPGTAHLKKVTAATLKAVKWQNEIDKEGVGVGCKIDLITTPR